VRLANNHYGCELLGIDQINENFLYQALEWLDENQQAIELNIFKQWKKENPGKDTHVFLYDVSSSYLEGNQNELAAFGYNRDKKKGKKQIVYGLLAAQDGNPLAIEAFKGNTADPKTFDAQLEKIKQLYQCKHVTLVGDKGMLKNIQIEQLNKENYRFITSISKPQIESMLKQGVIQLDLFSNELCEIQHQDTRYVLRRNPHRAADVGQNRASKIYAIEERARKANQYLASHPKAKTEVQQKNIESYIGKLNLAKTIKAVAGPSGKSIAIEKDEEALEQLSHLDGCYVIKTNVEKESLSKDEVHKQYKELAAVEWAFRITKSSLEIRPIYLRTEERTRGYLVICLLAYKIEKYLREKWASINTTVMEALASLSKITAIKAGVGEAEILRILTPDDYSKKLFDEANVSLPVALPKKSLNVVTYKNLKSERK
jgi:transposase